MSARQKVVQLSATIRRMSCVLTVAACSDIASSAHSEQTAAALIAASPVEITALAGSAVAELPAVTVVNSRKNPVAGIDVTFVSGDHASIVVARSGPDGVARVATWSAPHEAGASTIFANAIGLAPVRFELRTTAGPPASIRKLSGDQQLGYANESLPFDPSVRVVDAFGNAVSGVHVVFVIDSGSGSLKTSETNTNIDGIATAVAWTLNSIGRHALSAIVTGLSPQVFTAVAVESPARCGGERELAVGTTFRGQLTTEDCTDTRGRPFEFVGLSQREDEYRISLSSSDFDTALEIVDLFGTPIATNDNATVGSTDSVIRGLFAAGRMTAVVSTARPGDSGLFAVSYESSSSFNSCEAVFTMRGISAERTVRGAECPGITRPTDDYRIFLRAGKEVTVSILDRSYSAWQATMYDSTGNLVSTSRSSAAYVDTLTFIPPADGYYVLTIECSDTNGAYLLTIR